MLVLIQYHMRTVRFRTACSQFQDSMLTVSGQHAHSFRTACSQSGQHAHSQDSMLTVRTACSQFQDSMLTVSGQHAHSFRTACSVSGQHAHSLRTACSQFQDSMLIVSGQHVHSLRTSYTARLTLLLHFLVEIVDVQRLVRRILHRLSLPLAHTHHSEQRL